MSEHTPGPWKVDSKYCVGPVSQEDDQSYGMIIPVADVYGPNRKADAELIASAPQLREQNRVLRCAIEEYAKAKTDFDDKRLQEDHHAWRERYNKLVEAENALLQHRQGMEGVCDSSPEKPSCTPSCAYCNDPFYGHKGHR